MKQKIKNLKKSRQYFSQLQANKYENLDEMDSFIEKYNLPKWNLVKTLSLNGLITTEEVRNY